MGKRFGFRSFCLLCAASVLLISFTACGKSAASGGAYGITIELLAPRAHGFSF